MNVYCIHNKDICLQKRRTHMLGSNWPSCSTASPLFATIYQHNMHMEKQCICHLLRNLPAEISLAVFLKTVYKTDYKKCISWLQYSDDGSLDLVGVISHMRNPLWKTMLAEWWIAHSSTPWIQTFLVPKPWWVHRKFPELWWFNVDWTITTEALRIYPYNIAPRS